MLVHIDVNSLFFKCRNKVKKMSLEISWFSRHKVKILAIVIAAIVTGSIVGIVVWVTTQQTTKTTLYCYHAGSLTEPYADYAAM